MFRPTLRKGRFLIVDGVIGVRRGGITSGFFLTHLTVPLLLLLLLLWLLLHLLWLIRLLMIRVVRSVSTRPTHTAVATADGHKLSRRGRHDESQRLGMKLHW